MKLINIGFGNLVSQERLVAIVSPDSAPIKRMVQETRERGMLIDATYGRKTASIFIMDSDHVILSALPPERFSPKEQRGRGMHERKNVYYFRPIRRRQEHGAQALCWRSGRTCIFPYPPPPETPGPVSWTASIITLWMRSPSASGSPWTSFWNTPSMWATSTAPPSGSWMRPWIRGRM